MDVVIAKRDLLRLLINCAGAWEEKSIRPVLASVQLVAEGNALQVTATDGRLSMGDRELAEVKRAGVVCIPGRALLSCVQALPAGPVHVLAANGRVAVAAVAAPIRYELRVDEDLAFPALPEMPADASTFEVTMEVLRRLIYGVAFSISTDETRPNINAVLLEIGDQRLAMVATDGHRLTRMSIAVPGLMRAESMLISRKAILALRFLLEDAQRDVPSVTVARHAGYAFFQAGGARLTVRLTTASFPAYQEVLQKPEYEAISFRVARRPLREAIVSMAQIAVEPPKDAPADEAWRRAPGLKMSLATMRLRLEMTSTMGQASDDLTVEYPGGPGGTWTVHAPYLLEALDSMGDQREVVLAHQLYEPVSPIWIGAGDPRPGEDRVCIVMTMRPEP